MQWAQHPDAYECHVAVRPPYPLRIKTNRILSIWQKFC
ncbi:hypothetical protein NSERUTF1_6605 [Nocardia seriolae]|nr:hypothetical protein NSERUTF1_6605 [Nocardia seriolae]